MDNFIDPFLSSPTWPDTNSSSRSSWNGTVVSNANGLLAGSMQAYGNEKNPSICMVPSSHAIGSAAAEELNLHGHDATSSVLADENLKYDINKGLYSVERLSNLQCQNLHPTIMNNESHDRSFSLLGVISSNPLVGSFEQALPHSALAISSSIESNDSELSAFPQSLGDAHSITSVPTLWPSSYSSASPFMGQGKLQAFNFQGAESDDDMLRKPCFENGKFPHLDSMRSASTREQNEHHDLHFPSFSSGQHINLANGALQPTKEQNDSHLPSFTSGARTASSKSEGMLSSQKLPTYCERQNTGYQTNNPSAAQSNASGCNGGTVKPRVRARRGQATDPHSIAERLRREKIAERMKNLQELVPNSNKTDKASMLDEIIDYVKFLQLQVKVLSMSRLGAAGAVVPLLTDTQTEGSGSLLLSASFGQDIADISDSEDNLAFEQEVVKLMETNITTAMQYLQHKGLCIMPIALASAISNQKGSSTSIATDRRRTNANHETGTVSSINYMERKHIDEANDSISSIVKQEEGSKPIDSGRELIPKKRIAS